MSGLFDLSIEKPSDTPNIKFINLGRYLGKKRFYTFCKKFESFINTLDLDIKVFMNKPFYSWLVLEVSKIDEQDYAELSVNEKIFLPIAGKQLYCIERQASELEMSLIGYCESFNYILNEP